MFFDTGSIGPGDPWPERIRQELAEASVCLALFGKNWLRAQDHVSGKRKLDIETDWVRHELVSFLSRVHLDKTLSFVPILIDDAELPNKVFLEGTLGLICDHQSIRISTDDSLDFMPIKRYLRQKGFLSITPPLAVTPILGAVPKILIEEDEKKFLRNNKRWRIIESEKPNSAGEMIRELYRLFEFTDYPTTWEFMTRVHKDVIMVMNHHPRW